MQCLGLKESFNGERIGAAGAFRIGEVPDGAGTAGFKVPDGAGTAKRAGAARPMAADGAAAAKLELEGHASPARI